MPKKLDSGEKNFIRLIAKEQQNPEGWAPVSAVLYPLVKSMPRELVEHEETQDGRGRARLTDFGQAILLAMEWL